MDKIIDVDITDLHYDSSNLKAYEEILSRVQSGEECYKDNLGWLDLEQWASEKWINESIAFALKAQKIADTFVVIGVGGSNNSTRAILNAVKTNSGMNVIYAGNTLSSFSYEELLENLEGHDFVIDCIAKNFETLEPGLAFRILRNALIKKYGKEGAKERIFCTGTKGSAFEDIARSEGYSFIPFPTTIGGRYTALSPVHFVPMAAGGIDINKLVCGARDMANILKQASVSENPALLYAVARNYLYKKGYNIELLSFFEPRLTDFGKWWEQLFAESEGKQGKGLFPTMADFSEKLHSLGQFIQDGSPVLFETFLCVRNSGSSVKVPVDSIDDGFQYLNRLTVDDINKIAEESTISAHSKKNPCIRITIDKIDEYSIGALFYFFAFSCYLSCSILGVNPFDQPGVEDYKKEMFSKLGR